MVGMAAMMSDPVTNRDMWGFANIRDLLVGGTIIVWLPTGVLSSPFVILSLRRKDLRVAVPLVYGLSIVVVVAYMAYMAYNPPVFDPKYTRGDPVWLLKEWGLVFLSVILWSFVALFALPNKALIPSHICPECGYDRRGNSDRNCPECGAT